MGAVGVFAILWPASGAVHAHKISFGRTAILFARQAYIFVGLAYYRKVDHASMDRHNSHIEY